MNTPPDQPVLTGRPATPEELNQILSSQLTSPGGSPTEAVCSTLGSTASSTESSFPKVGTTDLRGGGVGFRQLPPRPRWVVRNNVYYCPPGRGPTVVQPKCGRWVYGEEEPYLRRTTATNTWVPLDHGWLKEVALLVLENDDPTPAPGPEATESETTAWRDGAVLVGVLPEQSRTEAAKYRTMFSEPRLTEPVTFACVHPGEHLILPPHRVGELFLRGGRTEPPIKIVLSLFPH